MSTELEIAARGRRPVAQLLDTPVPSDLGPAAPRRPDDVPAPVPVHWIEALLVFVLGWALFAAVGYHAVVVQHVVPGDALSAMSRAFYVWHNDPAKLAAIGFDQPPLQTIALLPFALVKPLASSLVALPVASGFWAAIALLFVHRTFARCGMPMAFRVAAVLLVAANPRWLFYAGTGLPDMVYLAALAGALYFLFTWVIEDQPRFVAGVGIALGLLCVTRFGFMIWAPLIMLVIYLALVRHGADEREREGLVTTVLAPPFASIIVWIVVCWVIAGDPFGWLQSTGDSHGLASGAPVPWDVGSLLSNTGWLLLGSTTTTLLALVALIWRASLGDAIASGLVLLTVGAVAIMVGDVVVNDDLALLSLRSALPVAVLGLAAAAWLSRVGGTAGMTLTLVGLAASIPITGVAMDRYPYQNLEQAFLRGLLHPGQDQEGTRSRGGYNVGISADQRMAAFIKAMAGKRKNSVLADNSTTAGVILLSGRPEVFADRVDRGDGRFQSLIRSPWGRVRYMLVAPGTGGDAIERTWPGATRGRVRGLQPVFSVGSTTLLLVSANDPRRAVGPATSGTGSSSRSGSAGSGASSGSGTRTGTTTTGSAGADPLATTQPELAP